MFRGKKEEKPKKGRRSSNNAFQFGLPGITDVDPTTGMSEPADDDDDDDLEAELMAILSTGSQPGKPKPRPKPVPDVNLDAMVAESMQDIPSDAELSGDDDDPELLGELQELTGGPPPVQSPPVFIPTSNPIISTLTERLNMYRIAESHAKASGEQAKVRRYSRGIKTLEDLLKKAERGVPVDENDIPLPVSIKKDEPSKSESDKVTSNPSEESVGSEDPTGSPSKVARSLPPEPPQDVQIRPSVPPRPAPPVPSQTEMARPPVPPRSAPSEPSAPMLQDTEENPTLVLLRNRMNEYKKAALIAKKQGDINTAIARVRIVKQFEGVIAAVEAGQEVDISTMPPALSESDFQAPEPSAAQPENNPPPKDPVAPTPTVVVEQAPQEDQEPESILGALESRMVKYKEQEENAKKEGNSSKVRRMGRIVKQYEDAIRLHRAGKPFPVDELPNPPGFPPIPVEAPPSPVPPRAAPSPTPQAKSPSSAPPPPTSTPAGGPPAQPSSSTSIPKSTQKTRVDKQLSVLLLRQKELKEAAIKAKRNNDLTGAMEYLRQAKRMQPLIQATQSGIPVDLTTIPISPKADAKLDPDTRQFEVIEMDDAMIQGTDGEVYGRLLAQLEVQIKLCLDVRNRYKSVGDVGNANKFERLALASKKDSDSLKNFRALKAPVPKFHYERRTFSILSCNSDLGDNDLEVTIVQGVNYNVPNPKEVDTYVRIELPLPNDDVRKEKTHTIYNTNNPDYNSTFTFEFQRNSRPMQRIFKRHALKCEVWSKGCSCGLSCPYQALKAVCYRGFLRSDTLIGTVTVKLAPLETKVTLHDSFDLMEGRRNVGGKLEVKLRVRNPIQGKQIEQVDEKWLVIS